MRVSVNETELYIDVAGSQLGIEADRVVERPTIVALHGGPGFDHAYLRPGLDPLASHAQVVYVDLRGQGRSGRPPVRTCTLEQMADDVAQACRLLGIAAPAVFGHSAGGFVALHLALRHPDSVGALILANTTPTLAPMPDDNPPPGLAERASPEAAEIAGRLFGGDFSAEMQDAFARLVAPFYAGPRHTDVPGRLLPLSVFSPDVARYFFGVLAGSYDLRPRLAEIGVPTLVISGGCDWVCPPVGQRTLASMIPNAGLVELPEAGHFAFAEEPAEFQRAVLAFLASVTPPATAPDEAAVSP